MINLNHTNFVLPEINITFAFLAYIKMTKKCIKDKTFTFCTVTYLYTMHPSRNSPTHRQKTLGSMGVSHKNSMCAYAHTRTLGVTHMSRTADMASAYMYTRISSYKDVISYSAHKCHARAKKNIFQKRC